MSDKLKEALDAVAELGRLQGRVIALEALLESEKAENARLKAEVADLKSQPDPLTAYLYAAELAKDEIKRLKAEVDLWKLRSDNWQNFCQLTRPEMTDELNRLKAEVERLTSENLLVREESDRHYQLWVNRGHEIDRLRKLGTEMGKHLPDTDAANRAYIDFEAGGES
jgi:predicted  nucleic acid-binding Zn-ribbon protein